MATFKLNEKRKTRLFRIIFWFVAFALAFLPFFIAFLYKFMTGNEKFYEEFAARKSGDFFWIGTVVLLSTLVDSISKGLRKTLRPINAGLTVFALLISFLGVGIYAVNIIDVSLSVIKIPIIDTAAYIWISICGALSFFIFLSRLED